MTEGMRRAHGGMALVFLGCAIVQYNDPDPFLWMGIYGMAAAISAAAVIDRVIPPLAAVLATVSLSGGVVLAKSVIGQQDLFGSEEGREMMGLLLVAFWIGGIALAHLIKAPGGGGEVDPPT